MAEKDMLYRSFDRIFSRKIKWTSASPGRIGYITVCRSGSSKLIGKISLSTNDGFRTPTSGKYIGYKCSIINQSVGQVDLTFFPFNDYLRPEMRIDKRPDYKDKNPFYVDRDMNWYIAVPAFDAVDRYVEKIYDYFKIFQL